MLVLAHLGWGLGRALFRTLPRTRAEIASYRERGAATYLLDSAQIGGGDAIEWLLQHTPADGAVWLRGSVQGPAEFAAALLWPRLLIDEGARADAARLGRTLARGTIAGREGELVLVATRTTLAVEVR